jgi:hypothetical protein
MFSPAKLKRTKDGSFYFVHLLTIILCMESAVGENEVPYCKFDVARSCTKYCILVTERLIVLTYYYTITWEKG